ncbi:MAG: hypothetical protein IJ715_01575 [Bacilli bacterium]|nr:hypothetical protein [Bacilli bacterium]
MSFIKKHKKLCIVGIILLVLLVLLIVLFKTFSVDYSLDEYGDRLDGIEKVEIKKSVSDKLVSEIKDIESVKKVNYRLKGRLVYIEIMFNEDVSIENAKEIAAKSLEYFTDDQKAFYDFEFILTNEKETEGYPELGSKHKSSDNIVW